jgi:hypothetical protein
MPDAGRSPKGPGGVVTERSSWADPAGRGLAPAGSAPSIDEAAVLLRDWGFLAHADLPNEPGDAYLLVAIRDHPTFAHFDPEQVEFWVNRGPAGHERGTRHTIWRTTHLPLSIAFSWGTIRIIDRLGISNEYITFGGHLEAAERSNATLCVFRSPAPLLRRGGHSQESDPGSFDFAAFFGRVMIAIDYVPGFEALAATTSPLGRYAACVADFADRYGRSADLRATRPDLWELVRKEQARLTHDHADAWAEGLVFREAAALD